MTARIAIVTGGTTGIGLACAKALVARGHRVAIGARRAGDAAVKAEVHRVVGDSVMLAALDVAERVSVDGFVASVRDALGPPTILVNAAGIYHEAFLHDHSDKAWDDQIEINLSGAFRMTRAVMPYMIGAGWGRIANIASTAGTRGERGYAAYCASKAGLIGLSKAVTDAELAETFESVLPNIEIMCVLHESLGGGGTVSLKNDAQGKTLSGAMLRMTIEVNEPITL